jgi:C4-dicarboxylate-specific signal transduction histidine kinase
MDMPKEAFFNMWITIQSGKSWKGEVKNLKKNKDSYWVMAYISPEYDSVGNIIGYAAVRQDITHKKALEELNKNLEEKITLEIEKNREKDLQLFNSAKMASLGEMIDNIAHQWRQPLSGISTMASGMLISKKYDNLSDETFTYYCNNIVETTQFLSETIDTFRDFLKEEKEIKKVVLQERITKTLNIEKATFNHHHITLIDNINYEEAIYINLIVGELTQVLINILNNAKDVLIKNQIENPWIKIDLIQNEKKAIITIEDNAGGIPENILPHIFEPYFTTKHQSQGTGLGLYMSYKIVVENLKGSLYAKNSEFGAKFFIVLETEN